MKFPKSAADVEQEILTSAAQYEKLGDLRIRQLIHVLQKADPELVLEGVIRVLEREDDADNYLRQEFAGRVLLSVCPKSQQVLKQILLRVLKSWNKSVKQFPFWLKENYGLDQLKEAFSQLQLTKIEQDKLQTIKWWLQWHETDTNP